MPLPPQQTSSGAYVPTTFIFDVAQLYQVDVTKPEFKELLVRMYQNINLMCNVLNVKETGMYLPQELVNSQSWFPDPTLNSTTPQVPSFRQNYRLVVECGALPAAGTKQIPHNLTVSNQYTFTRIYGCSTNPTLFTTPPTPFGAPPLGMNYIPLPYVSVRDATGSIELSVDQQNINITTAGTNYSNWTITYVVLEYLKL